MSNTKEYKITLTIPVIFDSKEVPAPKDLQERLQSWFETWDDERAPYRVQVFAEAFGNLVGYVSVICLEERVTVCYDATTVDSIVEVSEEV